MDCPNPHKKAHPTKEQAENAMAKAWRTGVHKHLPVRVYKCRCGKWHLTSKSVKWWAEDAS